MVDRSGHSVYGDVDQPTPTILLNPPTRWERRNSGIRLVSPIDLGRQGTRLIMTVEIDGDGIFIMHKLPTVQQLVGRMGGANVNPQQLQMGMESALWIAGHNYDRTYTDDNRVPYIPDRGTGTGNTEKERMNHRIFEAMNNYAQTPDWVQRGAYACAYVHKPPLGLPTGGLTDQGNELLPHCSEILDSILTNEPRLTHPDTWTKADEIILMGYLRLRTIRLLSVMHNAIEDITAKSRIERWSEIEKEMAERRALITDDQGRSIQEAMDHNKSQRAMEAAKRMGLDKKEQENAQEQEDEDEPPISRLPKPIPSYLLKNMDVKNVRSYDNVLAKIVRDVNVEDIGVTDYAYVHVGSLPTGIGRRDIDELTRFGLLNLRRFSKSGRGRPGLAATVNENGKNLLMDLKKRDVLPTDFTIRDTVDF